MNPTRAIFRREFGSYFATPLAVVFIVIFLMLSGVFTFEVGNFFETGQADLQVFFRFHPWLYLLLVPAVAMRLWADERKSGTLELLLTQPVTLWQAVLGKFLAAWAFVGLALMLTFPMWITVNWLGNPDNGVIFASYLGSWLMAGAMLAVGSCLSAATRSQVVAFILSVVICLVLLLAGYPLALDPAREFLMSLLGWFPSGFQAIGAQLVQAAVDAFSGLSFLTHFEAIIRGVLDLRDVAYFLLSIIAWLVATVLVIDLKKAN